MMEQLEYGMLNLLQFASQTTRTVDSTAQQSGEQSDFQSLIAQKSQTTSTKDASTATDKQTEPTQTPVTSKDGKTENEDALTRELACSQLLAAQTMPVVTVNEDVTVQQVVQPEVEVTAVTSIEPEVVTDMVADTPQTEQQPVEVQSEQEQIAPTETDTQQAPVEVEPEASVKTEDAPVTASPESAQTETRQQSEAPVQRDEQDTEITVTDAGAAQTQPVFQNVETHMVKVSETSDAESTSEAEPPEQQIATRLSDAIEQGESHVEIQLEPQSLGKVTVELTQHSDGSLHIILSADSTRTHSLLQQHSEALQQLLSGQDRKPVEIAVQHQQRSQDAPNYDGHHGQNQQQEQQQENRHSNHAKSSEDFLQQLRLGLVPLEAS